MEDGFRTPEANCEEEQESLDGFQPRLGCVRGAANALAHADRTMVRHRKFNLLWLSVSILCHRALLQSRRKRVAESRARRRTSRMRAVSRRPRK